MINDTLVKAKYNVNYITLPDQKSLQNILDKVQKSSSIFYILVNNRPIFDYYSFTKDKINISFANEFIWNMEIYNLESKEMHWVHYDEEEIDSLCSSVNFLSFSFS